MTKAEVERLTIVETKLDYIIKDMAIVKKDLKDSNDELKTYITHEVGTQKESVGLALANAKEANLKADSITTLKIEVGNNIKETIGHEVRTLKDDVAKKFDEVKDEFNKKIDELKTYQSTQIGSKTGIADFKSWITWAILIVGFIITYFGLKGGV